MEWVRVQLFGGPQVWAQLIRPVYVGLSAPCKTCGHSLRPSPVRQSARNVAQPAIRAMTRDPLATRTLPARPQPSAGVTHGSASAGAAASKRPGRSSAPAHRPSKASQAALRCRVSIPSGSGPPPDRRLDRHRRCRRGLVVPARLVRSRPVAKAQPGPSANQSTLQPSRATGAPKRTTPPAGRTAPRDRRSMGCTPEEVLCAARSTRPDRHQTSRTRRRTPLAK